MIEHLQELVKGFLQGFIFIGTIRSGYRVLHAKHEKV